jgi:hypothetical protein
VGLCLASQQQGGQVSDFHQLAGGTLLGYFQNGKREIGLVLKTNLSACYIHFCPAMNTLTDYILY